MIQCLAQATVIVGGVRSVKLIAVVDGTINIGDPDGLFIAAGGGAALSSTADVQCAVVNQAVYFTDGSTYKKLDCTTGSVSTFAATSGTLPAGCRLICNWRGRLVLARSDAEPHLWFMSRLGDETDWDYAETDPAAAVAGNNADAGTIGDVITALMPMSDDILAFGGDHTLWRMVGDPKAGGQIVPVSEQVGVIGARAWTQDPSGAVFFISPQGMHRLTSDGGVELLSTACADYFLDASKTTQTFTLLWDRDRFGLWIFRQAAATNSIHLFWSAQTQGFFPQSTVNEDIKPVCGLVYDGDEPDDRALCIGGDTDNIYFLDEDALSDDDDAIYSHVYIGLHNPAGLQGEGRAVRLDVTMGEYPTRSLLGIGVLWQLQAGRDPYEAMVAPVFTESGSWSTLTNIGRQTPQCVSVRGRCFWLKLFDSSNTQTWVYENASLEYQPAGRSR